MFVSAMKGGWLLLKEKEKRKKKGRRAGTLAEQVCR
jgi:hypothetical protein